MDNVIKDSNYFRTLTKNREGINTPTYWDPGEKDGGTIHNPPRGLSYERLAANSSMSYGMKLSHLVSNGIVGNERKSGDVFLEFAKNSIIPGLNTHNKNKILEAVSEIGITENMTASQMAEKFMEHNKPLGKDGWRARTSLATKVMMVLTFEGGKPGSGYENMKGPLFLDSKTADSMLNIMHDYHIKAALKLNNYGINPPLNTDFVKYIMSPDIKKEDIIKRGEELGLSPHEIQRQQLICQLGFDQAWFGVNSISHFGNRFAETLNSFFDKHKDKLPTPEEVARLANHIEKHKHDGYKVWKAENHYIDVLGQYYGEAWSPEQRAEYNKLTKRKVNYEQSYQKAETADNGFDTKKIKNYNHDIESSNSPSAISGFIETILDFLCEGMGPFGQKLKEMCSGIFGFDKKAELSKDEQGVTAKNPDGTETKITKAEIAKTIESNPLLNELAKQYKLNNDQAEQVKFLLENKSLTAEVMPSFDLDKELEKISKGEKLSTQAQIALLGTQAYQKLRGLYGDKAHPTEIKEQCAKLEKISDLLNTENIKNMSNAEIASYIQKNIKENGIASSKEGINDYSAFIIKASNLSNKETILNELGKENVVAQQNNVTIAAKAPNFGGF